MSQLAAIINRRTFIDAMNPPPSPTIPINIRPATLADIPFMDALQKLHKKQVGWMPTKQFEGKIKLGQVLIAESSRSSARSSESGDDSGVCGSGVRASNGSLSPVGYLIGQDQYFKRDDCGVVYQINVLPGKHRGYIGAALLKAQFERSAYGCKLYCCWCAQDIHANRFWEAMGFVPIAFRSGSEKKSRVHIFWQKRIRAGDTTTDWWYPAKTSGGSIREDRIVLPIPPGTKWSDELPRLYPEHQERPLLTQSVRSPRAPRKRAKRVEAEPAPVARRNGLSFSIPLPGEKLTDAKPKPAKSTTDPVSKSVKQKRACDPKMVAAARELRDRYLEQVNGGAVELQSAGKYALTREVDPREAIELELGQTVKAIAG